MNTPKFQYWFFIVFTILYFITLNKYFGISLESIKQLPANELGDFLAGTFSPLAFLFLILGYLQTNKSLGQTSEAITQQAIAIQQQSESLRQQAQSLDTQISELKLANTAYLRQVDEMEKSVAAQQNMFNLAERQYIEAQNEKTQSSTPQLRLLGSNYTNQKQHNNELFYKFILNFKVQNLPIKNIKLRSNFWNIAKNGGALDSKSNQEIDSIDANNSVVLIFYIRTTAVPFQNNYLYVDFYDEQNNTYTKQYQIKKTPDDFVLIEELILDN